MEHPRVAMLIFPFAPSPTGGSEQALLSAKRLCVRAVVVHIVTHGTNGLPAGEVIDDIPVVRLRVRGGHWQQGLWFLLKTTAWPWKRVKPVR